MSAVIEGDPTPDRKKGFEQLRSLTEERSKRLSALEQEISQRRKKSFAKFSGFLGGPHLKEVEKLQNEFDAFKRELDHVITKTEEHLQRVEIPVTVQRGKRRSRWKLTMEKHKPSVHLPSIQEERSSSESLPRSDNNRPTAADSKTDEMPSVRRFRADERSGASHSRRV